MAQILRAILFANAIVTSIRGFFVSMRANHDPSMTLLRPIQFNRDIAPIMSKRPVGDCPQPRIVQVSIHAPAKGAKSISSTIIYTQEV